MAQKEVASSLTSSQISHVISFGFTCFFADKPAVEGVETIKEEGVASTEDAKRLTGSDEAETVWVAVTVAACLLFLPRGFSTTSVAGTAAVGAGANGISSKTLRHRTLVGGLAYYIEDFSVEISIL